MTSEMYTISFYNKYVIKTPYERKVCLIIHKRLIIFSLSYRQMQTVQLDSKIKILDSPGIVFHTGSDNDASVALKNALRVGSLKDPVTPATAILKRAHKNTLVSLYCIPEFNTPQVSYLLLLLSANILNDVFPF